MTLYTDTFSTPFGEFSVAVDENSNLVATAFGGLAALKRRIRRMTRVEGTPPTNTPRHHDVGAVPSRRFTQTVQFVADARRTRRVREQVLGYCRGERRTFDLPLRPGGSPFQQRVWSELARIGRGTTKSYAEVARAIGSSPRAVGRANATNPICLIVPCHRVIGADGSLTGFAFGTALKKRLLEFESARQPTGR